MKDISPLLAGWDYVPGSLTVRKIEGRDGLPKIQIRMDMGLMQLEWSGRPDGLRPEGRESLLELYQERRRVWESGRGVQPFVLSPGDCWALSREAVKYYWRRISFFELKEYERAARDAEHNLAILDLCQECAEAEEDRRMAEQHRAFVIAHRVQARALAWLEEEEYDRALEEIRAGIREIESFYEDLGQYDQLEESLELRFLRDWEDEVEEVRPLTLKEQLRADLQAAVEQERFEVAALLRDRLRYLEAEQRIEASEEVD